LNNDLQNTTGTQKTKDWTMIYKILLVHWKLTIEQWSTNTTGTQETEDWTMIYKILLVHMKLKIEQWSTK
jgi:hypothetical protein